MFLNSVWLHVQIHYVEWFVKKCTIVVLIVFYPLKGVLKDNFSKTFGKNPFEAVY